MLFWMLNDTELLQLNASGFIPGPLETEEIFLQRVAIIKEKESQIPRAHWDWVRVHLHEIFGFSPECLPAFYSNKGLSLWQGAATWIEDGVPTVQLKEAFRKGSFLGYSRDEILAHEAVHAARSAFDEPRSEEFFAFFVSEKWWRKMFGPIVQRPWEVWAFGITLILSFWSGILAAICVGIGFWRLLLCHRRMRFAGRKLLQAVGDPKKARAVLFRLTDKEIELFSKGADVFEYAKNQTCLRFRLIRLAYLGEKDGRENCRS